jgi:glutamyl-tRNA reductase
MYIGVLGINHKLADLKLREQLAKICQQRFGASCSMHEGHHFVLLSTCNRTEIYFSSDDLAQTHSYLLNILRYDIKVEFEQKLYSYFGVDCFSHLSCVAAGLDSAIIAETEIQGQVKKAYEAALAYQSLPKELHLLFQKSLNISKKVRSELQLGRGMPAIEHAVFNAGKQFFKKPADTNILFVGASEINQKILSHFTTKKLSRITICNRSLEGAEMISKSTPVQIMKWERLIDWHDYDWIIFGTKSPDYLINAHVNTDLVSKKLIMDLCVPRNVDPMIVRNSQITLMNLDQLNRSLQIRNHGMTKSRIKAESMIHHAAGQLASRRSQNEHAKTSPLFYCAQA